MSGHSKFANIKHKKEKSDAQRGKIFTKLGRELMVAIKEGGPDPNSNSKLRDAIAKCKSNNMPNDTIQRSIKKYSGEGSNVEYESVTYEGYGPNGIAVIVECLTDNKNRSASDVRHAFSKNGGNLGTAGCVSFMFDKKGQIFVEVPEGADEEELMMTALDAGADDFSVEDGVGEIITAPESFNEVYEAIEKSGLTITGGEVTMIPQNYVTTDDQTVLDQMERLVDALEDSDDVQNVYTNLE
ncbi:MAG: YebC/PmpR family DNA-binding transcriptional regulator [Firmicutes bacterium]|nr:YebC/PmpR family DNA-binding transcriptional regulator [Bacillota bacterium]MBQ7059056.1 YebC/PmpR family DNA-binding transcriptional regulator [Bacillota bacterium]